MDDISLKNLIELLGYTPKVLFAFERAFPGWECDSKGWIVEDQQGKRIIILTNYGGPYIGDESELKDDIGRYEQLINNAEEALNTLRVK